MRYQQVENQNPPPRKGLKRKARSPRGGRGLGAESPVFDPWGQKCAHIFLSRRYATAGKACFLACLPVLLFLLAPVSLFAQSKYALVIGNGRYAALPRLSNPPNDAADMKAVLEGLDFQVEMLLEANLRQMEGGVLRLAERLKSAPDSYGFFFYAGHGVQSQGENYFIPADGDIRSESLLRDRSLPLRFLLDKLDEAKNALNMVVLDACRDNPFGWSRGASRGLTVVGRQPAETIIVYATSAGSAAADGDGRNGLFTGQLLRNLKIPGLEVNDIFRRTGADVRQASGGKQVPGIYTQFFGSACLSKAPAAPAPAPALPAVKTEEAVRPGQRPALVEMVRIPGGTFTMGSPVSEEGRREDELQHRVTISGFLMGKYEITNEQFLEITGLNRHYGEEKTLPAGHVYWHDAVLFCNLLSEREGFTPAYIIEKDQVYWDREADGYRLPTEAEWEYACRAGTTAAFYTGNTITVKEANFDGKRYPYPDPNDKDPDTYRDRPMPVGSFAPNAWGLHDMHGNVSEWCWDWVGPYSSRPAADPEGPPRPSTSTHGPHAARVHRGGAYYFTPNRLRSACRRFDRGALRGNGLRVARSLF
jgi:formylglycine-generating enzyme required for sulfatase activity